MKNILTLVISLVFFTVKAQVSMFMETGISSNGTNNSVGLQYLPSGSKIGVYATAGGNLMDKFIGSNNSLVLDSKGDFISNVSWYTKDGTVYPTLPADPIFTSAEWGNRLLETGTCVNTVERWMGELSTNVQIYNIGIVLKGKENIKYRIGAGIVNISKSGYCNYNYWQHTYNVSKYYDEWGVIAQPSGIFVVEHEGRVREWSETKYTNTNNSYFNMNFAIEYQMYNQALFSLGFNTKGGVNFGMGFPISK